MTATVRDEILDAWRGILVRAGCNRADVDALVLELDAACDGHGGRLPRTIRPVDPNAIALGPLPEPGDAAVGAAHARAELLAARARNTPPDAPAEPIPPLPNPED